MIAVHGLIQQRPGSVGRKKSNQRERFGTAGKAARRRGDDVCKRRGVHGRRADKDAPCHGEAEEDLGKVHDALGERVDEPAGGGGERDGGGRPWEWDQTRAGEETLDAGEEECVACGHGTASDGTVTRTGDLPIKGCVDRVVPCTGGAAHEEGADEEDGVCAEEVREPDARRAGRMECAEEVGEVEICETAGPIEAHELQVGNPCGGDVGEPAAGGRLIRGQVWKVVDRWHRSDVSLDRD